MTDVFKGHSFWMESQPRFVYKDGQMSACIDNRNPAFSILPKINNPTPKEVYNKLGVSNAPDTISVGETIVIGVDVSGHKCNCGACEDCEARFYELLHKR
jgi:hypothetical protein